VVFDKTEDGQTWGRTLHFNRYIWYQRRS